MKGISMPIELIVIIAIAVLVLVVVAAFVTGALGGGITDIGTEQAFSEGCARLLTIERCADTAASINIQDFHPSGLANGNLLHACRVKAGYEPTDSTFTDDECKELCGCA